MYSEPLRVIGESAPAAPQQYSTVGKLTYWGHRRDGTWIGVISSEGNRWTFTRKDILCEPEKLVEGQQVSFRSRFTEDFRGLGAADQVQPCKAQQIQQPSIEGDLNTLVARVLPERVIQQSPSPREFYGRVKFWAEQSKAGVIEADETERYPFAESDIVRGSAQEGAWAKFQTIGGRAVAVELA
jgi:hypothetical protein